MLWAGGDAFLFQPPKLRRITSLTLIPRFKTAVVHLALFEHRLD